MQEPYRNLHMDQLGSQLTICPILTCWNVTINPFHGSLFGFLDNIDCQFGNSSVWTWPRTRTLSDCPETMSNLLELPALTWYDDEMHLLLTTVPNRWFCCRSGLEPNWNYCNGFCHIKILNRPEPAVVWPVPLFRKLSTLAPIKCWSYDRFTTWYICKRCSFRCSFTMNCPISDGITICCFDSKNGWLSALFHRNWHKEKLFPTGRNGSVRVDAVRQSRQRHPGGGLLCAWHKYLSSHCISPSQRRFYVSSRSVGLVF